MPNEVIVAIIAAVGVVIAALISKARGKNMAGSEGPTAIVPSFVCHAAENRELSRELADRLHRRIDGVFNEISSVKDQLHAIKNVLHDLKNQRQ